MLQKLIQLLKERKEIVVGFLIIQSLVLLCALVPASMFLQLSAIQAWWIVGMQLFAALVFSLVLPVPKADGTK